MTIFNWESKVTQETKDSFLKLPCDSVEKLLKKLPGGSDGDFSRFDLVVNNFDPIPTYSKISIGPD